ncbi:MAG: T9SS type A sorting domain-containing protein [Cytophagales bacterium]|nr:T9SS type A sorting domain-containing protein [Cytophagales bacterium]
MQPYNHPHKLDQFNKFSQRLNKMIKDGSFKRLSNHQRNVLTHRLKRLYNQLLGLVPETKLKHILATAAIVIGLSAGTAYGQAFAPPKSNNFGIASVYNFAFPDFVDIDGDGDFDAFVGEYYGNIIYFENTGTNSTPEFAPPQTNSFGLTNVGGYFAAPAFADIDGDGDLDAFVGGEFSGTIQYFENTGNDTVPAFAAPITNPFGLTSIYNPFPTFTDIDGDGDFDMFAGDNYGALHYFENTGTGTVPVFAASQTNPFGLNSVAGIAFPDFVDIDGDGDFDAFVGEYYGSIKYFENIGTDSVPAFATPQTNPFGLTNAGGYFAAPDFVDIDADGDFDVFIGSGYGSVQFFENAGSVTTPAFIPPNIFGITSAIGWALPTFVDIDADGDFDAFIGEYYGALQYFENTGTNFAPAFDTAQTNPFGLDTVNGYIPAPTFVDIDADGDFDAFVGGDYYGNIIYFENTGTDTVPAFSLPQTNPFGLDSINGFFSAPTFVDIDGDGDFDAFLGEYYGVLKYSENTGTGTVPAFTAPQNNPFGLTSVYGYLAAPAFADIDGDGDFDAFAGGAYGGDITYYKNTGTNTSPAFALPQTNPFGLTNVNYFAFPAFVDIDGDGDFDAFVGEYGGSLQYFENITIANDAGVFAINAPVSGCGLSGNESVSIRVQNFGSAAQTNIGVSYRMNGGFPVSEIISGTINPGSDTLYTFFTATANLSAQGTYIFDFWTDLISDTNYFNDSITNYQVLNKPVISTYPFLENFESGNVGWLSSGLNSTWQLGAPAGPVINSAASGLNAWVTNLTGNYKNGDRSFVESPCFDFSNLAGLYVELSIWYNTEFSWDGAALYYSTDSGINWQKVGATGDSINWYNDSTITGLNWMGSREGWTGSSFGWLTAKHDLPALGGQPDVFFRIVYGSDGSVNNDDGFAFDDFRIYGTPISSIKENYLNPLGINIYPNPANGKINIHIHRKNESQNMTLEITNTIGKVLLTKQMYVSENGYTKEIDIAGLIKGVYFVKLRSKDKIITRKLVIL